MPCTLTVLPVRAQAQAKAAYVRRIRAARTVCIGNGRNDRLMLKGAHLGIAVVQTEGAAPVALYAADVVVGDVRDALDVLLEPLRPVATLRDSDDPSCRADSSGPARGLLPRPRCYNCRASRRHLGSNKGGDDV